jgi:PAS domain S-box-containing protein
MGQAFSPESSSTTNDLLMFYQDLVETSHDLIFQLDRSGNYTFLNAACEETFGYRMEEMIGRKFSEFQTPEYAQRDISTFIDLLNGKELHGYETVHISKDGQEVFLTVNAKAVINDTGTVCSIRGTAFNITSRKLTERKLIENEKILKEAQRLAHIGNWQLNLITKELTWSDEVYRIFEIEPGSAELTYEWFFTVIHPDDRKLVENAFQQSLIGESKYNVVHRIMFKDSRIKYVNEKCETVFDSSGNPLFSNGIVQDITDRKIAENRLFEEKELLDITLGNISDAVITTDISGKILIMNHVAEQLTGWTAGDASGKNIRSVLKLIRNSSPDEFENPVKTVLDEKKQVNFESLLQVESIDKKLKNVELSGAPIRKPDGSLFGVVLIVRDITEKLEYSTNLQRADKLEAIGVLAGGIAHDFNNLLGGIFGYIDLANETTNDPVISKYLSKVMSAIDRARGLTQQLLTFAKGGAPLKTPGDLKTLLRNSVPFALSGSNVLCKFEIDESLWQCSFDKNQIVQTIDNIVINAQQAMPLGGIVRVIASNCHIAEGEHSFLQAGNYVRIAIIDTGIGIPNEHIRKIFDPFFTTKEKGHGLGLSTCYSIVKRHGGFIDVESEPGKGSTFIIFLPADNKVILEQDKMSGKHKGSGIFVVMDDEEVIRETIGGMLELFGYTVVFKNDGEALLEYVRKAIPEGHIKALILDLTIPGGMGGKEVIQELRNLVGNIPVFVTSGYGDDPVMADPVTYGFTASICKPMRHFEFSQMLNNHIRS